MFRGLALLFGLVVAFVCAEVAVRLMGETDADGNFFYKDKAVGAIRPPVEWVREQLQKYKDSDQTRMIYDPNTGWSPRPHVVTHKGMYRYDARGIRTSGKEYTEKAKPGVLRIAIFGDSFAHGDDVPYEQSWGRLLEQKLNDGERRVEVINFGVSAYGMDQAFLRWRQLGKKFKPDIVLFGFQPENVNRNVNILRGFYVMHTGIPFSKPRFILNDGGKLEAVNIPALPPDDVPDVMAHMDDWKLAKYEWFYNPADFQRQWWQRSRFLSLLVDRITDATERTISQPEPTLTPGGEPAEVTRQLLREFRDEVKEQGGRFYVVHLPRKSDLARLDSGRSLTYKPLWDEIASEQQTIDPLTFLQRGVQRRGLDALFAAPKHTHYSDGGGQIIAEVVSQRLQSELQR